MNSEKYRLHKGLPNDAALLEHVYEGAEIMQEMARHHRQGHAWASVVLTVVDPAPNDPAVPGICRSSMSGASYLARSLYQQLIEIAAKSLRELDAMEAKARSKGGKREDSASSR